MLTRDDIPYPEEALGAEIYYTHNNVGFGLNEGKPREIGNWPLFYNAGNYIKKFSTGTVQNLNCYNFSVFQSNDRRSPNTMIGGYIRFLSDAANEIMGTPVNTPISDLLSPKKKKNETAVGKVGTEVFPDTDFMVTINYKDFPIGFLGFEINKQTGEIKIRQLQGSYMVDQTKTFFYKKHHLLNNIEWTKVLIVFFEDYLKNRDYKGKLIIQSSENNSYYTPGAKKDSRQERKNNNLTKHYNFTAEALGYEKNITPIGFNAGKNNDYSKTI